MEETETKFNQTRRNDDDNGVNFTSESSVLSSEFPTLGKPIGVAKTFTLQPLEKTQAHRYLLFSFKIVDKFVEKIKTEVQRMNQYRRMLSEEVEQYMHKNFHDWLRDHVKVAAKDDMDITPKIELLAQGPNSIARRFDGYNIHGFKFHTKGREQGMKTQNNVVSASTMSYLSHKDGNPTLGEVMYYGRLVDILELDYYGQLRIVLFKCDWVDTTPNRGNKIDELGITNVNFSCFSTKKPLVIR